MRIDHTTADPDHTVRDLLETRDHPRSVVRIQRADEDGQAAVRAGEIDR
jgi:hypothetical protein